MTSAPSPDPDPATNLHSAVADPVAVVREVTAALARGDLLAVMARVTRDVRWAVNAADRDGAPWFRPYEGKAELPAFFEALSQLKFEDFTVKAITTDGIVVITWLHVAFTSPSGRRVDMDEVQVWQLREGKVCQVDTLLDTAAVAAAFA